MKNLNLNNVLVALSAAAALTACSSSSANTTAEVPVEAPASVAAKMPSLVDVAMADGNFTTLIAALKAAGLDSTLAGDGPFTIFAPSDEAFKKIDGDVLEDLLANKDKLTKVLTYHVLPGALSASEVRDLNGAKTVNGATISAEDEGGAVKIGGANIVKTDIKAENGIIHVIDTVLMPSM